MAEKWMQKARESMEKRGTVGSFSKAAHKAGMSTHKFAVKEKHAGGKMGKKANFALNAAKSKHK